MKKLVSTNAVVAKALAMNGWDSKMGWELESKIESAIKSEVGIVTDVGAAFRDGGLSTGGNRNGAITVGLYDDKARENVGRIKQIVEKVLKQYGGGRITSQKEMKVAGEDAVKFTVARNSRAMNATSDGLAKEYRDYLRSEVQKLIQEVGSSQSYLFQQSDRLKNLSVKWGSDKSVESLFVLHRRVDAALDSIVAQLRKIIGY